MAHVSPRRKQILALLRTNGEMSSTAIIMALQPISHSNIHQILRKMRNEGALQARLNLSQGRADAIWYKVPEAQP